MVFRAYTGVELQSSNWFSKTRSTKLNRFSATQKKKSHFSFWHRLVFERTTSCQIFKMFLLKNLLLKIATKNFRNVEIWRTAVPLLRHWLQTTRRVTTFNSARVPKKRGKIPYVNSTTRICSRYTVAHKCPSISTTLRHEQIRRSCFLFASRTNVKYTTNCTLPL